MTEPTDHVAEAPRATARWLAVALVMLIVIGAVVAASLPSGPAGPLDATWYRWMVAAETPWLVTVAEWFDLVGSAVVMVPFAVAVGVVLVGLRRWGDVAFWTVAMIGSEIASTVLKVLYGRERPPDPLEVEPTLSFPSGHSKTAAVVAVAAVVLLTAPGSNRRRWVAVTGAVYALAMALSRTYLRAHWLTDVLGGLALGTAVALAALLVISRWNARRHGGTV